MKICIVIPARFSSTRFPGKPLTDLAGKTLLQRSINTAKRAIKNFNNNLVNLSRDLNSKQLKNKDLTNIDFKLIVATDDNKIFNHAIDCNVTAVMTDQNLKTGTDRVLQAIKNYNIKNKNSENKINNYIPNIVINLQGDNPFLPSEYITEIIKNLININFNQEMILTPIMQLTWEELDKLRENKKITPFSGTTVVIDNKTQEAKWFSKNIIPAIRQENLLRSNININDKNPEKKSLNLYKTINLSPIYKHIGLYCYTMPALEKFVELPETDLEKLEGLEQLRALDNNIKIKTVKVKTRSKFIMGIDSEEDKKRFLKLIEEYGDPEKSGEVINSTSW